MATTIVRTPWIDDDGSGTTGTVLNNAVKTELYDQIDGALASLDTSVGTTLLISSATGTQHNWNPGITGAHTTILWTGTSDLLITGLAGGTVAGQLVTIKNAGAMKATLAHMSASSVDPNKLINIAASGLTPIGASGSITYQYDGLHWHLIAHEQGAWITAPFSAANFTANTGTWTVEAADVRACKYRLSGRSLSVNFLLETTTTAGGPNNLQIGNGAWGGFTINDSNVPTLFSNRASKCVDSGGMVDAQINSYGNMIYFVKLSLAPWAASTDAVLVNGQITVEVN